MWHLGQTWELAKIITNISMDYAQHRKLRLTVTSRTSFMWVDGRLHYVCLGGILAWYAWVLTLLNLAMAEDKFKLAEHVIHGCVRIIYNTKVTVLNSKHT